MDIDDIKYPDFSESIRKTIKEDIGIDFTFVSDEEYDAMSIDEKKIYDRRRLNYWDWYSILEYARKKGYRKGYMESKASIYKSLSVPYESISQATGLSVEEIEKL